MTAALYELQNINQTIKMDKIKEKSLKKHLCLKQN
jgi:hypothetical protein